jgi:PAS domain S-box-containing protein
MTDPSPNGAHDAAMTLQEKEEQLRLATEAADIGFWDLQVDTQRLYWPPRLKAMFGLPPDGHVTLADFEQGLHPDDREAVLRAFAAAQDPQLRAVYDVEYRAVGRDDGRVRWLAAKGRALFDAEGRCTRVLGTAIDITPRKEAEALQRASEERLSMLDDLGEATRALTDATEVMQVTAQRLGEHLHATRCAYADVDPDNDRFTIRSDWSRAGVPSSAGVYSLDLFGPRATANLRNGRHLVVDDVDRELGDEGGSRMFKAIGIRAIICAGLVKEGRLVAMMAVHQAEPRHWTEHEISLVGEVVDRCWAHIERVRDAAMLREQDRRKDEFLATLAHELRNPIAPLRYATALLQRVDDAARQQKACEVIERQSGHLARLIDDLLDISRINRGLVALQRETVALAPLLLQAIEAARPALERAGHRLTVDLPDDDVRIDADPARIVQVFTNLLNNAVKYTPTGGDLRLRGRAAASEVVVDVADNGIGIAPQDQGRLFQPFTQLAPAGRPVQGSQGGLGIGLSLVRRLAEMHGGQVTLRSAGTGQGSTFTVTLPIAAPPPASCAVDEPAATHTGRVLVVEDNADGLDMLVTLLGAAGHEVRGVASGEAALAAVAQWPPQVVLLDLGLPGIDGLEVARRVRAHAALQATRLVALTGWGAHRDRQQTARAGFDAHLTKPVDPQALMRLLAEWLAPPVRT